MNGSSEIEYRVALEQWHVDMAYAASCEIVAIRHLELARRCSDYRIAAADIGKIDVKLNANLEIAKLSAKPFFSFLQRAVHNLVSFSDR